MSLEIKGSPSSAQKLDSTKPQNPLLEAESAKSDKRSGGGGFSGLFGSIISVAKASFVPELQSGTKDRVSSEPLVEADRDVDGPRDDGGRLGANERGGDSKYKQDVRDEGKQRSVEERSDYEHGPSGDDTPRESQEPVERKGDADSLGRQKGQRDQSEVTSDEVGREIGQKEGGKAGVDSEKSGAEKKESGIDSSGKAKGEVNQVQQSKVGKAGQDVVAAGDDFSVDGVDSGAESLGIKGLLSLLIGIQNILSSSVKEAKDGEIDIDDIVNKIVASIGGEWSADEKEALKNVIGSIMAKLEADGNLNKETLAKGVSLDAIANALNEAFQKPDSEVLVRVLDKIFQATAQQAGNQKGGVSEDDVLQALKDGKADPELLDKVLRTVARALSDIKGEGNNQSRQGAVQVNVERSKVGNERVQTLGILDSQVLDELQGSGKTDNLKETRDISDDLRLRASRTFVEGDAKKIDNVITKTTGSLLNQLSSAAVVAGDVRAQARESMERFALSGKGSGDLTGGANKQSAEGRSSEQVRTLSDLLLSSKALEGRGQSERFGDSGLLRSGSSNASFASQLDGLSDKSTNAPKGAESGNNRQLFHNVQEQVRVNIQRAVNAGEDRIRLQLRPAELGRIDIRINVSKDGTYTLRVFVEKQETLDLLRSDSKSLIDSLKESGIKADGDNLEFSLQKGGEEEAQEQKKKKELGSQLEINEDVLAGESDDIATILAGSESDDSSDEDDERLDVVV